MEEALEEASVVSISEKDDNVEASPFLPEKEIDASIHPCCWLSTALCTFGAVPYRTKIHFGDEEVTKKDVDMCGAHISKRPYTELGSVDRGNCLCFVSAESALGPVSPGCGCDEDLVDDIVSEFKKRIRYRGDVAQVRQAEQTLKRLEEVDAKLDRILNHLNIPQSSHMDDRGDVKDSVAGTEYTRVTLS